MRKHLEWKVNNMFTMMIFQAICVYNYQPISYQYSPFPAGIYLFKVNSENTRTMSRSPFRLFMLTLNK